MRIDGVRGGKLGLKVIRDSAFRTWLTLFHDAHLMNCKLIRINVMTIDFQHFDYNGENWRCLCHSVTTHFNPLSNSGINNKFFDVFYLFIRTFQFPESQSFLSPIHKDSQRWSHYGFVLVLTSIFNYFNKADQKISKPNIL